ncbi:pupal cuticle protein Edg-78E-like [Teleopsis dalmanni]|uniref:pupal cuticle protein Edg-78E-like n=1 Tax=Teleopsis dalmanni TaxID=139649 RepID=UPI0018CEEA5D|nr:pupal cuticle protein Edg-78E-like [Teleopsis dalmanni]XP_037956538.1 pupal cuticle protein Edg-78E-like [Teleopsis dalmanni]
MFKLLILTVFLAFVSADNIDKNAEIRSYVNEAADAEGKYQYAYETSNGIQFQEAGNAAGVRGSLNYVSPEGEHISLQYTADEEGYHPVGEHLPTPPPVPAYVLRALEYIRSHPPAQLKEQQ